MSLRDRASQALTPEPLRLFHGTTNEFDRFRRRRGDIGLHFGTAEQAWDRIAYIGRNRTEPAGERIIPVEVVIRNPLRLPDLGAWDYENVAMCLPERVATKEEVREARTLSGLRKLLQSKGYDGIVYRNEGEVAGLVDLMLEEELLYREAKEEIGFASGVTAEQQRHPAYVRYKEAYDRRWAYVREHAEDSYIAFDPAQVVRIGFAEALPPTRKKSRSLSRRA